MFPPHVPEGAGRGHTAVRSADSRLAETFQVVRLSIGLEPADHAELSRLAEQHDLSVAWMVGKAVSECVERNACQDRPVLPLYRGGGGAQWIVEKNGCLSPAHARRAWDAAMPLRPAA